MEGRVTYQPTVNDIELEGLVVDNEGVIDEGNIDARKQIDEEEHFTGRYGYFIFMIGFSIQNIVVFFTYLLSGNNVVEDVLLISISCLLTIMFIFIDGLVYCDQCSNDSYCKINRVIGCLMPISIFGLTIIEFVGFYSISDDNFDFTTFLILFFLVLHPKLLISLDWYLYYVKRDHEGVFGMNVNPSKCLIVVTLNLSGILWSINIAMFSDKYSFEIEEWIQTIFVLQSIITTLILLCSLFWMHSNRSDCTIIKRRWLYYGLNIFAIAFIFCGIIQMAVLTFVICNMGMVITFSVIIFYLSYCVPVPLALFQIEEGNRERIYM
eukprot:288538_1